MSDPSPLLSVIVVSVNGRKWLDACLASVYGRCGGLNLDVIVVDAGTDGSGQYVHERFGDATVVDADNRGFAAANNRALEISSAPFVLFLNPDTEIVDGTLAELVKALEDRPTVGLLGVRQVGTHGELQYSMRRFPSVPRSFFEAIGSERFPIRTSWMGERILDPERYDQECRCDWTSGSFMLARREAIDSSGFLDERFFLYAEEPDLCRRMHTAGWEVRHLPVMTVVHHGGSTNNDPSLEAQRAYSRKLYMRKHYPAWGRALGTAALALNYGIRAIASGAHERRRASRAAFMTVLGFRPPPFGPVPAQAVALRAPRDASSS